MDTIFWMQRTARQKFSSVESDFRHFLNVAEQMEKSARLVDARQAHSRLQFAAHALLRAARDMRAVGLSAGGSAVQAAREYLSPENLAELDKRLRGGNGKEAPRHE